MKLFGLLKKIPQKAGKFFRYVNKFGLRAAFFRIFQKANERKHIKSITHTISNERRAEESAHRFDPDIKFSILVPLYNTPEQFLRDMIDSVLGQTYSNFELCLADGSDDSHSYVGEVSLEYASRDARVLYKHLDENRGISENTNAAIDMASGDYIALFDHDDILHPSALFEMMKKISDGADFVYTDEVVFESPDIKNIIFTHYKPDFAPENLLANNYICHFSAFSRELLDKAGRFRHEFDGSQDHDLILRLTAAANKVEHIPKVLYFWRSHPASVAQSIGAKTYAIKAGQGAVRAAVEARGGSAEVTSTEASPTVYRIKYDYPDDASVSIILYNVKTVKELKRSLNALSDGKISFKYEIVLLADEDRYAEFSSASRLFAQDIRVIKNENTSLPANLNRAVSNASYEYILFLNGAKERYGEEWLAELLMYASRDDVGVTAGKILYTDATVRHAGYILSGSDGEIAARLFHGVHSNSVGYMMRLCYPQDLSAVSDEMMLVKRSFHEEIGGFDESLETYYDIDFCLRARSVGRAVVWTPHAAAYLVSNKLRSSPRSDRERMREKWKNILDYEPYYNPNFREGSVDFSF